MTLTLSSILPAPSDNHLDTITLADELQCAIESHLGADAIKEIEIDFNSPLPNGQLPLHMAVQEGQLKLIGPLIAKGANPEERDYQGKTAFDYAIFHNDTLILEDLFCGKLTGELVKIKQAIDNRGGDEELRVIKNTIDRLKASEEKLDDLQKAALKGDLEEVENQWDDEEHLSKEGLSLLHLAVLGGSKDVVEFILGKKWNPDTTDDWERTPLHFAAVGSKEIFLLLLDKEANLHANSLREVEPLTVMAAQVRSKDPLAISNMQWLMFALTTARLAAYVGVQAGMLNAEPTAILAAASAATSLISAWEAGGSLTSLIHLASSAFMALVSPLDFAENGFMQEVCQSVMVFSNSIQALGVYAIGTQALDALKQMYNNPYRAFDGLKKVTVSLVNTGAAIESLGKGLMRQANHARLFIKGRDFEGYDWRGLNEESYNRDGLKYAGNQFWKKDGHSVGGGAHCRAHQQPGHLDQWGRNNNGELPGYKDCFEKETSNVDLMCLFEKPEKKVTTLVTNMLKDNPDEELPLNSAKLKSALEHWASQPKGEEGPQATAGLPHVVKCLTGLETECSTLLKRYGTPFKETFERVPLPKDPTTFTVRELNSKGEVVGMKSEPQPFIQQNATDQAESALKAG